MQPSDLNMTTQVTGHQRFLFIRIPQDNADAELSQATDSLGKGVYVYGAHPTPEGWRRAADLKKSQIQSDQAFVAMRLNEEMRSA